MQFIRVQCEIEHAAPRATLEALRKQEKQLLAKNRTKWMADVPKHLRNKAGMRGGFVGHLDVPAKTVLKYGAELFDRFPVHSLRVTDLTGKPLNLLAVEPYLSRLRSLVVCDLRSTELEVLLSSPFLNTSAKLDLSSNPVGSRGCTALANWTGLKGLTSLNLYAAGVTDGARTDTLCPGAPALEELMLMNNNVGNAGAEALAGWASLTKLRRLWRRATRSVPRAPGRWPSRRTWPGCASCTWATTRSPTRAKALAESPHLTGLALLQLHNVELGDNAVAALRQRFGDRVTFA